MKKKNRGKKLLEIEKNKILRTVFEPLDPPLLEASTLDSGKHLKSTDHQSFSAPDFARMHTYSQIISAPNLLALAL